MFKLTLPNLKPRNPLVAAARFRRAGAHRAGTGAQRQRSAREMRAEIDRMRPPSP
jgi:hypothetical protein